MKTRAGFVSNSSSSSFVIITTKKAWDAATKELTKKLENKNIAKIVIGEYGEGENATVLGQKALVFQGVMTTEEYGSSTIYEMEKNGEITEEESEILSETAYEYMGDLEEILRKDGVSYVGGSSY